MPPRGSKKVNGSYVTDFDSVASQVANNANIDPQQAKALKEKDAELKAKANSLSSKTVVENISKLGLQINSSLNQIEQVTLDKLQEYEELAAAVEAERKELERVAGQAVVAQEIAAMVHEHDLIRKSWEAEVLAKQKADAEYSSELSKSRSREQAEYEYNTALARKKQSDEYALKIRDQANANKEIQEKFNKDMAQREQAMKDQENELKRLQAVEANLGATIAAEVSKAVAAKTAELQQAHNHANALKDAEFNSEKRATQVLNDALRDTIASLEEQVERLTAEANAKSQQVQEIAVAAVQSASGREALESVQAVAMSKPEQGSGKK